MNAVSKLFTELPYPEFDQALLTLFAKADFGKSIPNFMVSRFHLKINLGISFLSSFLEKRWTL